MFRSVEKELSVGVDSEEIKPVSEMTDDDGVRSEAMLVTSISLKEVDKAEVGVEDSSSSACGEPSSGERVNVSVTSPDSMLICDVVKSDGDDDVSSALDKTVVGVADSSSGERVNVSVSSPGDELTSSDELEDDEGNGVVGDSSLRVCGDTCDSVETVTVEVSVVVSSISA